MSTFRRVKVPHNVCILFHLEVSLPEQCNKNEDIKLKIGKPNNVNVFVSNKSKGHQKQNQNRLWSPMPEGGEP